MPMHFPPQTLKFLRGLAKNNDRDWFQARKDIYETAVKQPMLALIEEINASMAEFAPEHVRPPHRIMMRIYRDTRFSPDKRPYKRQISAWWARQGMEKTSGGGFYMHIHPQEVLVSCGVYMPERDQLLAIRRYLAEHHEEYRALEKKILRAKAAGMSAVDGSLLARMPKGFPKDHPEEALLRARNWGVHATLPAKLAEDPRLAREIVSRMKLAAPLIALLNAPLVKPVKRAQVHFGAGF
jgi:uncharacterized protein (TIGR02453 family)